MWGEEGSLGVELVFILVFMKWLFKGFCKVEGNFFRGGVVF